MKSTLLRPTPEQCSAHAPISWTDSRGRECRGVAGYYPQMGGYTGRCVIEPSPTNNTPCFDVWVWHDGEFPFGDDDVRSSAVPVLVHHCMWEQFVQFGQDMKAAAEELLPLGHPFQPLEGAEERCGFSIGGGSSPVAYCGRGASAHSK